MPTLPDEILVQELGPLVTDVRDLIALRLASRRFSVLFSDDWLWCLQSERYWGRLGPLLPLASGQSEMQRFVEWSGHSYWNAQRRSSVVYTCDYEDGFLNDPQVPRLVVKGPRAAAICDPNVYLYDASRASGASAASSISNLSERPVTTQPSGRMMWLDFNQERYYAIHMSPFELGVFDAKFVPLHSCSLPKGSVTATLDERNRRVYSYNAVGGLDVYDLASQCLTPIASPAPFSRSFGWSLQTRVPHCISGDVFACGATNALYDCSVVVYDCRASAVATAISMHGSSVNMGNFVTNDMSLFTLVHSYEGHALAAWDLRCPKTARECVTYPSSAYPVAPLTASNLFVAVTDYELGTVLIDTKTLSPKKLSVLVPELQPAGAYGCQRAALDAYDDTRLLSITVENSVTDGKTNPWWLKLRQTVRFDAITF
jgi:hypothetical protein